MIMSKDLTTMVSKQNKRKFKKCKLTHHCKTKVYHKNHIDLSKRDLVNGTVILRLMLTWSQFPGTTWPDSLKDHMAATTLLTHQLLKLHYRLLSNKERASRNTELRLTLRSFLMLLETTLGTSIPMMAPTLENIRLTLHKLTLLRLNMSFLIQLIFLLIQIHFFLAPKLRRSNGLKKRLLPPLLDFQSQMLGANPPFQTQIQLKKTKVPLMPLLLLRMQEPRQPPMEL